MIALSVSSKNQLHNSYVLMQESKQHVNYYRGYLKYNVIFIINITIYLRRDFVSNIVYSVRSSPLHKDGRSFKTNHIVVFIIYQSAKVCDSQAG